MRKLGLGEWAAIGETENIIFEMHSDLANQFMLDPTLAEILVKMRQDQPELTEVEAVRWENTS